MSQRTREAIGRSPARQRTHGAVACSGDGTKLLAAWYDDYGLPAMGAIFTSTNSGSSWEVALAPAIPLGAAASADGTTFVGVGWVPRPGGFIPFSYVTTNWGATSYSIPFQDLGSWACASSSARWNKTHGGSRGSERRESDFSF